jgi:hypothetical protein
VSGVKTGWVLQSVAPLPQARHEYLLDLIIKNERKGTSAKYLPADPILSEGYRPLPQLRHRFRQALLK